MSLFGNSKGIVTQDKQAMVNHRQVWRSIREGQLLLGFRGKLEWVALNKSLLEKNKSLRL